MTPPPRSSVELPPLLHAMRLARFPDGVACPRCACRRVIRWGRFSGRQRYRCSGCGRTFSDLTGTAAMYLKRLDRLSDYRACMQRYLSVRASARSIGVHATTAFRWRHRLLKHAYRLDQTRLSGIVEIEEGWVVCCPPLEAGLRRPRWSSGSMLDRNNRRAWLLSLCDRRGRTWIEFAGLDRPFVDDVTSTLAENLSEEPAILVSRQRRCSRHAIAARQIGVAFRSTASAPRGADVPLETTTGALRRLMHFRTWLRRFRGVTPRYLQNYIAWLDLTDLDRAGRHINQILEWPLPRSRPGTTAVAWSSPAPTVGRPTAAAG